MEPVVVRKPGRGLLAGALAVLAIVACVGVGLAWPRLTRSALQRAELALANGEYARAAALARQALDHHPTDPRALRVAARAATRLAQDTEAQAFYARLQPTELETGDLVLLAEGLARQGRPSLAALALASALAAQPREPEALRAQGQLFAQAGRNAEWARTAEHLGAVPPGPARVELLFGLLRQNENTRLESRMIERLLARDRARLRALKAPQDVRRLLARVLLELQQPALARAELEPLLLAQRTDPEASWLMSRAYLQEGRPDDARQALAQAGDYGPEHAGEPEPAPYVGEAACASCHQAIHQAVTHSRHAATLRPAAELETLPLPEGTISTADDPGTRLRLERESGQIRVEVEGGGDGEGELAHAVVRYLLGSGHRGTTLVVHDDRGTDRKLRLSYYTNPAAWDYTDQFPDPARDAHERIGLPLSAESLKDCLHCHATDGQAKRDGRAPVAADHGIGCERCHGPGANHLKAVAADFPEMAIVQPRLTTAAERLATCAQCHRSDGSIPPTEPGYIRFQTPNLVQSRCYVESKGQLDCTTCHNPHRNAETSAAHYESKCLACHGGAGEKPEPRSVAGRACPVNPKNGCLSCHMPTVPDVAMHSAFTDHRIRVRRETKASE